jgi:hypothetical protein
MSDSLARRLPARAGRKQTVGLHIEILGPLDSHPPGAVTIRVNGQKTALSQTALPFRSRHPYRFRVGSGYS